MLHNMKATPAGEGIGLALGSWKVLILVTLTFFMYHKGIIKSKIQVKSRNDKEIILKNQLKH